MPVTITGRPQVISGGSTSNWVASSNPIVYRLIRKDYASATVVNSGGKIQITVTTADDLISAMPVGSTHYFESDNSVYALSVTVFSISLSLGTYTITFNESYTSAATTGWINLSTRLSYYVSIGVYLNGIVKFRIKAVPNSVGRIVVDVQDIKKYLSPDNTQDYSSFTYVGDSLITTQFYISTQEVWVGTTKVESGDSSFTFRTVLAARQLGSIHGGNLFDYIVFNSTNIGKFLNLFTRPKIFRGFPWSISIAVDNTASASLKFYVEYYSISGSLISTGSTAAIDFRDQVMKFNPNNILAIPYNAVTCKISIRDSAGTTYYSENLTCDIVDQCSDSAAFFGWKNSLGGDSFWCFEFSQDLSYKYKDFVSKRLKCFTNYITQNEFDVLSEINTIGSNYVPFIEELTSSINKTQLRIGQQIYKYDLSDFSKKIGVISIPTEVSTKTSRLKHSFECLVELPEIFVP